MERDPSFQFAPRPRSTESNFLDASPNEQHFTEKEIANEVCQLAGARSIRKTVRMALKMESPNNIERKSYADLLCLPTKMYLESTLVPALINGIAHVERVRPVSPIKTLAVFLLKNKSFYETEAEIEADSKVGSGASKSKSRIAAMASKIISSYRV
ncbi:unnamed protein product [Psylliodes chrysocephalus]|uniref:Uncharacterized protein n=1 Tax=Psylliodes chrysocephalus TaxID=3402493 RepID=A0A9P0CX44_9CUCU|nr:unnamed protein product [Psylliodes chrysocephala]